MSVFDTRRTVLYSFYTVCSNASEVMETQGWNNLVSNHPSLVADAFKALALSVVSRSKRPRLSSDQTTSSSTSTTTTIVAGPSGSH